MTRSADLWDQSLWYATAAEPDAPSDGAEDADVLIVGGGITGLSAALHLAERGKAVTLIEAQRIGHGASGRNGGQVIPGLKLDPSMMREKWGAEVGGRLAAFAGGAADQVFDLVERHGIACTPVRGGWIQAAHSPTALRSVQSRARDWEAEGVRVEHLDRKAIAEAIGTETYSGGWRDPRAGTINPLSYTRGLARAARAAGARIVTGRTVSALRQVGAGWELDLGGPTVSAPAVLLATNAYDASLQPQIACSLLPVQSNIIATEPLPDQIAQTILPQGACCSETRKLAFYFRMTPERRFVFGGRGGVGTEHSRALQAALEAGMRRMFPQLRDCRVERAWSGHLALTMDGLPHVHRPAPGLWAAAGYNGRGIAMATALGAGLAGQIAEGSPLPLPETAIRPIAWHGLRKPVMNLGIRYYWMKDKLGLAS